jgi:pullulanase/glycogen debranching enzyme
VKTGIVRHVAFYRAGARIDQQLSRVKSVELCLFDENSVEQRIDLPGRSGDIWHGYVPTLKPGPAARQIDTLLHAVFIKQA